MAASQARELIEGRRSNGMRFWASAVVASLQVDAAT